MVGGLGVDQMRRNSKMKGVICLLPFGILEN